MLMYQDYNSVKANHFRHAFFQDNVMPNHFHTSFEVMYAIKGEIPFQLDGENFLLKEGELCLFMPNQLHSFTVSEEAFLWVCVFSGDLVETFNKNMKNRRYSCPVFTPSQMLKGSLPILSETQSENPYLLQSLLYRICYEFDSQKLSFITVPDTDNSSLHKIMCYLTMHYNEDITLNTLSKEFGLHKNYISSLLKQITHQNFRAYLNSYRLENAKELLRNSKLSVTAIAYECGYNDIRTFNRAFLKHQNCTPTEYRETHSKQI